MSKKSILDIYDYLLIVGIILTNVLYSWLTGQYDLLASIAAITGVICVVLVAKGSIWNYLFGIVNVTLYSYVAFKSGIYGDAALNALYYFPMQFIGLWLWKKRGGSQAKQVKARRLTPLQAVLLGMACAVLIVGLGYVLRYYGDPQPFKDATTTILSIVAQALMALAFMEQWILWIVSNVISVVMWLMLAISPESGNPQDSVNAWIMVIMWSFYLLNALNGLRVWLKLSERH